MSIGLVCWSIVEGQGRVPLATLVEVVSSWVVVIPVASLLVFVFNFNLLGIVGALVIGYTVGGIWTTYIIFTTDWEAQSNILIERCAAPAVALHKSSWASLSEDVHNAARILGYTEASWTGQTKTPLMTNNTWENLSNEQRTAARLLGFNRVIWGQDWDVKGCDTDSSGANTKRYDDYDWDDLPSEIQDAATTLGYTKRHWNKDLTPKECDAYWRNLTTEQQEAALKLGYTRETWDDDSNKNTRD